MALAQRTYDATSLRAALSGRPQRSFGAAALQSFTDSTRRAPLRIREIVRANGDETPFVFEKGVLLWGVEWVSAIVVASEMAIHVIEYRSQRSAVCSYNRLMRLDEVDNASTVTLGLCLYLGATPIATKLTRREEFPRTELALHVIEAPKTADLMRVAERARAGFEASGVPEDAHRISRFVF